MTEFSYNCILKFCKIKHRSVVSSHQPAPFNFNFISWGTSSFSAGPQLCIKERLFCSTLPLNSTGLAVIRLVHHRPSTGLESPVWQMPAREPSSLTGSAVKPSPRLREPKGPRSKLWLWIQLSMMILFVAVASHWPQLRAQILWAAHSSSLSSNSGPRLFFCVVLGSEGRTETGAVLVQCYLPQLNPVHGFVFTTFSFFFLSLLLICLDHHDLYGGLAT